MVFLLDSNVCLDLMRGHPNVVAAFRKVSPDDCAISAVSVFELRSGAGKSQNPSRELDRVERLRKPLIELPWDVAAASCAAQIRCTLEAKGQEIGAYDTLLAGHAVVLNLTLVTDNVGEFSRVEGLSVENWRK